MLAHFAVQGEASSAAESIYKYEPWEHAYCFNQMKNKMQKKQQISNDLNH